MKYLINLLFLFCISVVTFTLMHYNGYSAVYIFTAHVAIGAVLGFVTGFLGLYF